MHEVWHTASTEADHSHRVAPAKPEVIRSCGHGLQCGRDGHEMFYRNERSSKSLSKMDAILIIFIYLFDRLILCRSCAPLLFMNEQFACSLSVCLHVAYLSVYLASSLSIFICLSVYLSICLSIFICLSVYLSVRPSVY